METGVRESYLTLINGYTYWSLWHSSKQLLRAMINQEQISSLRPSRNRVTRRRLRRLQLRTGKSHVNISGLHRLSLRYPADSGVTCTISDLHVAPSFSACEGFGIDLTIPGKKHPPLVIMDSIATRASWLVGSLVLAKTSRPPANQYNQTSLMASTLYLAKHCQQFLASNLHDDFFSLDSDCNGPRNLFYLVCHNETTWPRVMRQNFLGRFLSTLSLAISYCPSHVSQVRRLDLRYFFPDLFYFDKKKKRPNTAIVIIAFRSHL